MSDGIAFSPGSYPKNGAALQRYPLQRYLPPLPEGVGSGWLSARLKAGSWVLDAFGASPRLAVEIARGGYYLLAAVNNPIARFLIELYANPPEEAELVAALADLGSAHKSGERIEPQIRSLYYTECAQCGGLIEAQAFVWESEINQLVGKIYTCPICKDSGERPASPTDLARATKSAGGALHRSRALERVAPLADPDRETVEEALAMYPPRAVRALFDLINRLETLPQQRRRQASALLLAAFDQGNGLWHQPPVRSRPRKLNLPPRYLEKNVWFALEEAIHSWSADLSETSGGGQPVPVTIWPELPADGPGICLYEGRLKDLSDEIQSSAHRAVQIEAVVGALPRPNQAYWTLSALWAGWLWGHNASGPFKSVLRRRRYDWGWHAVALTSAMTGMAALLQKDCPCLGLIGEAEPGFLAAVLLAGELSGLDLEGVALRSETEQAQIVWKRGIDRTAREASEPERRATIRREMMDYLKQRGEPASYIKVHSAALYGLARSHLAAVPVGGGPAEALRQIEESISAVLTHSSQIIQLGGSVRSLETGQWWLEDQALLTGEIAQPLADRVEMAVVRSLQAQPGIILHDIDIIVCQELRGLLTPDPQLVRACLESYGVQEPAESGKWRLRPQDEPAARRADLAEMQTQLLGLGERLGFRAEVTIPGAEGGVRPQILWLDEAGVERYRIHLSASGLLGRILTTPAEAGGTGREAAKRFIVLPGGRASLVEYKLRRDGWLRGIVEGGGAF